MSQQMQQACTLDPNEPRLTQGASAVTSALSLPQRPAALASKLSAVSENPFLAARLDGTAISQQSQQTKLFDQSQSRPVQEMSTLTRLSSLPQNSFAASRETQTVVIHREQRVQHRPQMQNLDSSQLTAAQRAFGGPFASTVAAAGVATPDLKSRIESDVEMVDSGSHSVAGSGNPFARFTFNRRPTGNTTRWQR